MLLLLHPWCPLLTFGPAHPNLLLTPQQRPSQPLVLLALQHLPTPLPQGGRVTPPMLLFLLLQLLLLPWLLPYLVPLRTAPSL